MAWTNKQKMIAVKACRAAGLNEDQRVDMILRSFPHAHYAGDITSRAPRLTSKDFAAFMSIVERYAGGQILHFTPGYWERANADELQRMRFRARKIAAELEAAGKLAPGGVGLAGWIEKRVSKGATNRIEDLAYPSLQALIIGLEAHARQGREAEAAPSDAEAVAV
jgi:hypothetical protein